MSTSKNSPLTILVEEEIESKFLKLYNSSDSNTFSSPFCNKCGCGPLAPNVFGNTLFCSLCRDIPK